MKKALKVFIISKLQTLNYQNIQLTNQELSTQSVDWIE